MVILSLCWRFAQKLGVDFLPITWQPALDAIGEGGTSEIRQSLINLQMSLAFKRLVRRQTGFVTRALSVSLISEVSILAHPSMRNHPTMMPLFGLCWDISEHEKVLPVLVFEKSPYGDLVNFMNSDAANRISFEERLKLCATVALAIATMHSCGGEFLLFF
jgi:hypothetical protein